MQCVCNDYVKGSVLDKLRKLRTVIESYIRRCKVWGPVGLLLLDEGSGTPEEPDLSTDFRTLPISRPASKRLEECFLVEGQAEQEESEGLSRTQQKPSSGRIQVQTQPSLGLASLTTVSSSLSCQYES